MDLSLSWDLFVVVLFIVIVSYSLIMGRDSTIKVIIGTYVSVFTADALGNFFEIYLSGSKLFSKILSIASISNVPDAVIFVKIVIFVTLVILFAVRGAFEIRTTTDSSPVVRTVMSFSYAMMSAGLIITSILVFVAGISLVGGGTSESLDVALWWISKQSKLIPFISTNSYIMFAMPAVVFLIHSIYSRKEE